jgi:RNA polymerase-binding transcription factor DksA
MATKAKKKPASKAKAKPAVKNKKAAKPAAKKAKAAPKVKSKPVSKKTAKKAAKPAKAKPAKKVAKVKLAKKAVAKVVSKPAKAAKPEKKPKLSPDKIALRYTQKGVLKGPDKIRVLPSGVGAVSTNAIKHVEKHDEKRSRRRSRAARPIVKPTPIPRTTPLRIDPVLPDTPVNNMLKKPIAILNNKAKANPNKTRYNDDELLMFKKLIIGKIEAAKKELTNLQTFLNNSNEHGTDDTASSFKMLEDGSDTLAKEEAGQLAARQRKFIEQLENALVRIENKTYGICRVTGQLIPKERLMAVPHTTQSIEAKVQQYRD